ncbi:hypothetical protein SVAN01_02889 [Stagonosporopsis vannaccii]|nr:hypothetical protein SVAN01_02889 [Stagonosporopsis vannaccii]
MATRIPAWRRLGLALQNEVQSGVAVTEPTASHEGENQPVATPDAVRDTQEPSEPAVEPTQNGKSSKLGKRKHQLEAAEKSEPTSQKKIRITTEESHAPAETAAGAPDVAQEDHFMADTTMGESTATPVKGGDPHYRQGKKKKPKLTQKDRRKQAQLKSIAPSPAEAVPVRTRATLLASTEVDHSPAPTFSNPQKHQPILRDRSKDSSGSPPRTDRRKSVAFTPDTKRVDGDSGQTWFKKWAAEQKGEDPEALTQPSFTSAPATIEDSKKKEKREKKEKKDKVSAKEKEAAAYAASAAAKEEQSAAQPASEPSKLPKDIKDKPAAAAAAAKGKKKDPSIYISYLTQYYKDRDNWKFNKAKQNDVVDNALNVFRIPDEHSDALLEYIKGLKGAGVIERLREKTLATIKELDAEEAKAPAEMDQEAQKAAKNAALQERVAKERKRRKVEGDVERLATHPNGDAYIRRMRRSRAEALLSALGRTAPILPAPKPTTSISPMAQNIAPVQRARKSKRRTDISSDESSSDSSSDESSSDESESEADETSGSASGSASDSSSNSGSSSDGSDGSDSNSDSTNSRITPSFLPSELVDQIASYLDLPTFRSFRLTASQFHTQTTHSFKQRFFTTRYLKWKKLSLQRFVDVSTDPDLSGACRHLIIDATPQHALLLWKMRRRSADAGYMTPITDDEDCIKLARRLNADYESLQRKAETATRWLNETRFDVKCLTTVFPRLVSLESITFAYEGMEIRYSKFGDRYCETSQHEMSRPFISTLFALAASKIRVRRINMHNKNKYGAVSIGRLESLAPSLSSFDAAFENLETLQLNLRDWRSPDSGFEIETNRAPFVVRFMAKCSNVRDLELSCYSELEDNIFRSLARTCRFTKLERCKLDSLQISHHRDLVEFLTNNSCLLKELHLQHLLLADPGATWDTLFVSLANAPSLLTSLHSLKVSRLCSLQIFAPVGHVLFIDQNHESYSLLIEGADWRAQLKNRGRKYMMLNAVSKWEAGSTSYPFIGLDERVWGC